MRIDRYKRPETSFLSVERDLETLSMEIAKNENVKKLLFLVGSELWDNPATNPMRAKETLDELVPQEMWPWKKGRDVVRVDGLKESERQEKIKKLKEEGYRLITPTQSLFNGRNIKIVPRVPIDTELLNYVIISFDSFTGSDNPEFRNNLIYFDVICHFDEWSLDNFALRPYRIAAEIDRMFSGKKLSGIGTLNFIGANQVLLTEEFGGLTLAFSATHGDDDKVLNPTQPRDVDKYGHYLGLGDEE